MKSKQLADLLNGLDPDLVTWLACDCLELAATDLDAIGEGARLHVYGTVAMVRNRLYDGSVTARVMSIDRARFYTVEDWASDGKADLYQAARLVIYGSSDTRVTDLASRNLDGEWLAEHVKWLKSVWDICGARSIHLLYENRCPIEKEPKEEPEEPIYILVPGDMEKTNWIRVLCWMAYMWLAVALIKFLTIFI